MPQFVFTSPEGRQYTITGPDGATKEQAWAILQQQLGGPKESTRERLIRENPGEYDHTSPEWQAKYGATSGMSGTQKFLAGAGKGMVDLARGVGQMVGVVSRDDIRESRTLDAPLMNTTAGKVGNFVGTVAPLVPLAFVPGVNTMAGAAAVGAGTGLAAPSASTKETLLNTAMGGALGPAGLAAGRALGVGVNLVKGAVEPFFEGGQRRIAAGALQSVAGDDAARAAARHALSNPPDVLPGVRPLTAELADNAGLAQLQRSVFNQTENLNPLAQRQQANRHAMVGALDELAGDPAQRAAAESAREAATQGLYQAATRANYPVDDALASLLERPAVQQAMARARTLAANDGRPFTFDVTPSNPFSGAGTQGAAATRQITGQGLQDLKMAMDEMLTDPTSGFSGKTGRALRSLRAQIVNWMESANPDFRLARETYRDLSQPINAMDVGQRLRDTLVPAIGDFGNTTRLNAAQFTRALRNGDAIAADVTEIPSMTLGDVFTADQQGTLRLVGEQLARQANAAELGRAVGSNTAQNLISQNLLRRTFGPLGMPESWLQTVAQSTLGNTILRPAQFAGRLGQERATDVLRQAVLEPSLADELLRLPYRGSFFRDRQGLLPVFSPQIREALSSPPDGLGDILADGGVPPTVPAQQPASSSDDVYAPQTVTAMDRARAARGGGPLRAPQPGLGLGDLLIAP